jgi:hypothetical protein
MNELNVNLQHTILTLAGNGWSNRRIARELGINRETVGKYLLLARPKPAISTPGSEPDSNSKPAIPISGSEPSPDSKPAISTAGSAAGRQSLCQPLSPQIEAAAAVAFVVVGLFTRINAAWLAAALSGAILQNLLSGRDPRLAVLHTLVVVRLILMGGGRYSLEARKLAKGKPQST